MSDTVLSVEFTLAEWKFYFVPDGDEKKWGPDSRPDTDPVRRLDPDNAFQPIREKFVYIFARHSLLTTFLSDIPVNPDKDAALYAEIFVDRDGEVAWTPLDRNKSIPERDKRPAPQKSTPSRKTISLGRELNGQKVFYYFYVSRIRLPKKFIEALQIDIESKLPAVDLDLLNNDVINTSRGWTVGATDPLTVALNFNRRYQEARNELLGFTTVFEGQDETQRKRTEDRQKTKLLAEILQAVLLRKKSLANLLKAPPDDVQSFLTDYKNQLNHRIENADRAAAPLCHWLDGRLINEIAVPSYHVFPQEDLHKLLDVYAECADRLSESAPGKAFLGGIIEDKSHFVHQFIFRQSPASEEIFQVARKSVAAIFTLLHEFVPLQIKIGDTQVVSFTAKSLQFVSRLEILEVTSTTRRLPVRKDEKFIELTMAFVEIKVNTENLNAWVANAGRFSKALDVAFALVELVNFALSVRAFSKADNELAKKAQAMIGAIGSMLDFVSAFGEVLKLSGKPIKVVGGISAVIDTYQAHVDAVAMAKRSDYSAMVGFMLVEIGSGLIALGCAISLDAASLAAVGASAITGWGFVAAILVAIGWILAIFTRDSDIELFVRHCVFGVNEGTGEDSPTWVGSKFKDWKGNIDLQLTALFNILAAFTLSMEGIFSPDAGVKILTGATEANSKFTVNFNIKFESDVPSFIPPQSFRPRLVVDCSKKALSQIGGDPIDPARSGVFFSELQDGRQFIQVKAIPHPSIAPHPSQKIASANCQVLLDLQGDGKRPIPGSKNLVSHLMFDLENKINTSTTCSKDF